MPVDLIRLEQANRVLDIIDRGTRLIYEKRFFVEWVQSNGVKKRKGWVPNGRGSNYPRGEWEFGFGGTQCTCISFLMRWCRSEPVMDMRFWRRCVSVGVNAGVLPILEEIGWPKESPCCMCGRIVTPSDRIDWYDWRGAGSNVWGPGCHHSDESGCRGKNPKENHNAAM